MLLCLQQNALFRDTDNTKKQCEINGKVLFNDPLREPLNVYDCKLIYSERLVSALQSQFFQRHLADYPNLCL